MANRPDVVLPHEQVKGAWLTLMKDRTEADNLAKVSSVTVRWQSKVEGKGKAKVAGTSQADKTVTFEAGKTDYFFLEEYAHDMSRATGLSGEESGPEPQTAKPPLGDLAAITLRVEESGSASIKFSTDATVTFRVLKENFFDDWDCKWVGVTRLAIGGAGGETKQYSFPCSGTEAAQDFGRPVPDI